MSAARLRALVLAVLAIALVALAYAELRKPPQAAVPRGRPPLLLLTSLPLMFGEDFSLEGNGSAVLEALQSEYRVVPISVADPAELARGRILLMAQPRAQPPEDLVALDEWVRAGGRVLLLADPMLEWPSKRPLGDLTRPPVIFPDTGLLGHWGLRLDAPEQPGPKPATIGDHEVTAISAGQLRGGCAISRDGIVARCRIGKGSATVIADADFLDIARLDSSASQSLAALLAELAALQ